jgi:hypothetical protein
MNIFVVDEHPVIAAQSLCDKHVVKMITESAQMLSTAHRVLDDIPENDITLYKKAHVNHPCSIWCRENVTNYRWLYRHYRAMSEEYTRRYGKLHGAFYNNDIGQRLYKSPLRIDYGPLTKFPIAMKQYPDCIIEDDVVESYRNYYRTAKREFAKWTNREVPSWFNAKSTRPIY